MALTPEKIARKNREELEHPQEFFDKIFSLFGRIYLTIFFEKS